MGRPRKTSESRKSFLFDKSWAPLLGFSEETGRRLTGEDHVSAEEIVGVIEYILAHEIGHSVDQLPKLTQAQWMAWRAIKCSLDQAAAKYDTTCENRSRGAFIREAKKRGEYEDTGYQVPEMPDVADELD